MVGWIEVVEGWFPGFFLPKVPSVIDILGIHLGSAALTSHGLAEMRLSIRLLK